MPFFVCAEFYKIKLKQTYRCYFEFVTSSSKLKQSYTDDYYLNRI